MLQMIRNKQSTTLTYSASSVVAADIRASGALTRLVLRVRLTPSGSMAAAVQEDGIFRILQTLAIKGAGGVHYFSMGDEQIGRMLHLLNMHDRLIRGTGHGPLAAVNDLVFVIHFGSRPRDAFGRDNPFDLSALVPAFDDSELRIEWGCPANTVVDDTVTISGAVMHVSVHEVLGTAQEIKAEMARQGVRVAMVPTSSYRSYAHTGNLSDLSAEFDVPTGAYLRRIALMAQDDTATRPLRADDEVTKVGLKLPIGNQRIFEEDFAALVYQQGAVQSVLVDDNAVTGGSPVVGAGFGVIDCRELAHPDYGLNLMAYKSGDVKMGLTIENYAAGDDTFLWYDQVRPYSF